MADKMIELVCEECKTVFYRRLAEVNRNKKRGRKTFCSLNCAGKQGNGHLKYWQNLPFPEEFRGRKTDEYSPFRYYMKCVKQRKKHNNKDYNIDLSYLKELWEKQNGKCPYTGIHMELHSDAKILTPYSASLDRINTKIGYIKGNIEYVSYMANVAKNKFEKLDVINFCRLVSQNYSNN